MARIDGSNMQGGTARQSDPSGGLSAFRGGASMDGTQGDGAIPTEKYVVGGDAASEAVMSQDYHGGNNDLQGMYDRIMGSNPNTTGNNNLSKVQEMEQPMSGTLIHNPTIN